MTTATANAVAGDSFSSATQSEQSGMETYANDASFESVKNMLKMVAGKFFRRVQAQGLPMEFEDVYQEVCTSYVLAAKTWKPDGGAKFITYCVYAAQNNFNAAIRKMERDRKEMGMTAIEDMCRTEDGSAATDWLEGATANASHSPDYGLMQKSSFNKEAMKSLSVSAKKFIAVFLKSQIDVKSDDLNCAEIAKSLQIEGRELRRLKLEMLNTYGVTWR